VQCFKSEVVKDLETDQRGGETSSAGVVDESGNLPRAASTRLPGGLQTPRSLPDGSESGPMTGPMNPESTQTSAKYKTFAYVKCVRLRPDGRLDDLFRPI